MIGFLGRGWAADPDGNIYKAGKHGGVMKREQDGTWSVTFNSVFEPVIGLRNRNEAITSFMFTWMIELGNAQVA